MTSAVWTILLGIKCVSPYVAELIVRNGDTNNGITVDLNTFIGIIDKLLENVLFTPHIKKFFSMKERHLSKILQQRNQPLTVLFKLICKRVNVLNIRNVYCLLTDKTHGIRVLNNLSETMIANSQQNNNLLFEISCLLHRFCYEMICKKNYSSAHKISKVANELIRSYSLHGEARNAVGYEEPSPKIPCRLPCVMGHHGTSWKGCAHGITLPMYFWPLFP